MYLVADKSTDGFLGGAESLVPGALVAVRVVANSGAGSGDGGTWDLGRGMGSFVFSLGLVLTELTLGLVATVASEAAEGALGRASGRVDVGLESGGLVLGHGDGDDR